MSIDSAEDERVALASAWRLQRTGNFVAAFDRAQEALRRFPDSRALAHLSVLALASCGSTEAALEAFHATSLGAAPDEDFLALEARLLKDAAFSRRAGTEAVLRRAAQTYEEVASRTDGTYSRQNAALLWTLAGDGPRAERLARSVAGRITELNVPDQEEAAYFHWATLAEAALVLDDRELLKRAVVRANPLCRQNSWARSRTFLQMRRLSGLRPDLSDVVDGWYRPPVGLLLSSDCLAREPEIGAGLDGSDRPGLVYCVGGGRSGWQALAASGIQLHVIYPGAPDDEPNAPSPMVQSPRDASGHGDSHTWSSLLLDEGDDHDRICAEAALGLSLGHADALCAPWTVLAQSGGRWHAHRDPDRQGIRAAIASRAQGGEERSRYGFLFADAVSYSSLNAADTRRYWTQLLPKTAAEVLRRHSSSIVLRKSWGDAVHAVFRTASAAASAALEMQAATAQLAEELEPGRRLSFRIAVHYGAADQGFDPVEEAPSIFGPQLSFAARIVPVAPPGGVFVTEPFAAQLTLEGAGNVHCSYVGTTSLAKSYGRVRLLTLA
ncbi:MAG TPA: adenylate/guanylate cyclase domain-containing protein [Steroidobacteraceae bacterium]